MRNEPYWASRVHELRALPQETGWLEFKHNNAEPQEFGFDPKNSATASRLIKEALVAGAVRRHDPDAPPKLRRYMPSGT